MLCAPLVLDPAGLDAEACRRLLVAVLLAACLDAHEGRADARDWLTSDQARAWAEELGFDAWPPTPDMLAGRGELRRRAADLNR